MKKKILAICGSTRSDSSNLKLLKLLAHWAADPFEFTIFEGLSGIPHFNPDLDVEPAPESVAAFREAVSAADGVIICTPEYVFSLPGSLKNALEWLVSTIIFDKKTTGLITASANGEKGHEQLILVMRTLSAAFSPDTTLLINGVKGKFDPSGNLQDESTHIRLLAFWKAFQAALDVNG